MEGYELRRIRRAHGLSTQQLAAMVNVPTPAVESWELEAGAPGFKPIERDARRRMLLKLAALRAAQRETSIAPPRLRADFTPRTGKLLRL